MLGHHQDTVRTPDLVEEIIGWRGWNLCLTIDDTPPTLISPHFRDEDTATNWRGGKLSWDGKCRCIKNNVPRYEAELAKIEAGIDTLTAQAPELAVMMAAITIGEGCDPKTATAHRRLGKRHELYAQYHKLKALLVEATTNPCHCGINAFATCDQLMDSSYRDDAYVKVLGSVALSGEVRSFERGWRAERARVLSVWSREESYAHYVERACEAAGIEYLGVIDLPPVDHSG